MHVNLDSLTPQNICLRDFLLTLVILSVSISPEIPVWTVSPGTEFTIRIEDLLIAIVGVAWFVHPRFKKRVKLPGFFKYFAVYLVLLGTISLINSWLGNLSILRATFYLLKQTEVMLLGVLVLITAKYKSNLTTITHLIILSGLLNASWAFYQMATGNYGPLFYTADLNKWRYGTSLIGQPSVLASGGYYVPSICLATASFIVNQDYRKKILYVVIFLILFVGMAGAVSRSAILGSVAAVISIIGLYSRWSPQYYLKIVIPGFAFITLILATLGIPVIDRFSNASNGIAIRLMFWIPLLQDAFPQAILGWGAGSVQLLAYEEAHNYFIRTLIVGGVAGFSLFLITLVKILQHSHALAMKSTVKERQSLAMMALGTTIAYSVMSLFQDAFLNVKLAEMFWISVGAMAAGLMLDWDELGRENQTLDSE